MSKYIWRCLVALLLLLLGATYYQYSEWKKQQSIHQTRADRVQLQDVEQQQSVLEQHSKHRLFTVLGEDFSTLQIRMAEHLSSLQRLRQHSGRENARQSETQKLQSAAAGQDAYADLHAQVNGLTGTVTSYRQSLLPDALQLTANTHSVNADLFKFRTLRVDVRFQASNAPDMLDFLRQLKTAAGGWPGEVRACDMHRSPRPGIDARCVVDIYHWTVHTDASDGNT